MLYRIRIFLRNLPLVKEFHLLFAVLKGELLRVALLAGIGLLFLRPDAPTLALVSYSFGLSFLLIAMSHVIRKILFRHIDLQDYTDEALKGNVAAAIVFASICLSLAAFMYVMAAPLLRM